MGKSTVYRIHDQDPKLPEKKRHRTPAKWSDAMLNEVCENLANGADQVTAALAAGISWQSVMAHAKGDPAVRAALEAAQGAAIRDVSRSLFDAATGRGGAKPSVTAQVEFLKRRGGPAWQDRSEIDVTSHGESIGDILRGAVMDAIAPKAIDANVIDVESGTPEEDVDTEETSD